MFPSIDDIYSTLEDLIPIRRKDLQGNYKISLCPFPLL
jgi:hypothetical protein